MKKRKYSFKAGGCRNSLIKPSRNILFDCSSILLLPKGPFEDIFGRVIEKICTKKSNMSVIIDSLISF